MLNLVKTIAIATLVTLSLTEMLGTTANAQSVGAFKDIAQSQAQSKASSSVGGSSLGNLTGGSNSLGSLGGITGGLNSIGSLGGITGGSTSIGSLGGITGGSTSLGSLGGVIGVAADSLSNKEKLTAGKVLLGGGSKTDVAVAVGKSRAKDSLKGRAGSFIN